MLAVTPSTDRHLVCSVSSHFLLFQLLPIEPEKQHQNIFLTQLSARFMCSCVGAATLTRCLNSAARLPFDSSMFITLVFVPKMLNLRNLEDDQVHFSVCDYGMVLTLATVSLMLAVCMSYPFFSAQSLWSKDMRNVEVKGHAGHPSKRRRGHTYRTALGLSAGSCTPAASPGTWTQTGSGWVTCNG